MKHSTILVALFVAAANFSDAAQAANSYLTNPMGLAYRYMTNVSPYGRPGGMVIASGCNRYDAAFATARANGAEILAYLNPVERPDYSICERVTHVSDQATYATVTAPPIAFNRLTDRPKRFGRSSRGTLFTSGLAVNTKRGSRFTLTQKGTLLNMSAYVDGGGGPSGAQNLRMALYRDSNGVPGALVAQSNAMSVTAGSASRWLYFPAGATALNPGTYWIMIHSGSPSAVTRIKCDGAANWHGNSDVYSDGAANPAGAGSLGTMTLSLFASYTVGY